MNDKNDFFMGIFVVFGHWMPLRRQMYHVYEFAFSFFISFIECIKAHRNNEMKARTNKYLKASFYFYYFLIYSLLCVHCVWVFYYENSLQLHYIFIHRWNTCTFNPINPFRFFFCSYCDVSFSTSQVWEAKSKNKIP